MSIKNKSFILALLLILFSALNVFAQEETSIKAEVDNTRISTDDTLTYKIIIASSKEKLPKPKLPKFEGFKILSQAQSSTISFMKSKIKIIQVYVLILSPAKLGKFKIEPSQIKVENETYSSEAFLVEIIQGRTKLTPPPKEEKPLAPEEIQPEESQEPQYTI